MLAAVLSDTHGYFDERLIPQLVDVDVILHAGDVGSVDVLTRLAEFAPVYAVEGNNDLPLNLGLKPMLEFELEGHAIQIVHELPHAQPGSEVIVHGHSHKMLNEWRGDTLYLNPGAAGRRGFHAVQSMALLHLETGALPKARLIVLGPRLPSAATPRRSSR